MNKSVKESQHTCKTDVESISQYKEKLPGIVENIIDNCDDSQ